MKLIERLVVLSMIAVLALTGCTSLGSLDASNDDEGEQVQDEMTESKYQVLEYGFSDSISGAVHKVEFPYWNEEKYIASDIPQSYSVKIGNMELHGEYKESVKLSSNNFATHKYSGDVTDFEIDENGVLAYCFLSRSQLLEEENLEILSQEQCQEIAVEYLRAFVDPEQYEIEVRYSEGDQIYRFTFTKYLGGFKTADMARIGVTNTGIVLTFSSRMLGRIPSDTKVDFDETEIEVAIRQKLDLIYADVRERIYEVTYESIGSTVTILESGEVVLLCTFEVKCISELDGYDGYYYILGELVSFIVGEDLNV